MSAKNRKEKEARLHQLQQEQIILANKLAIIERGLREVTVEMGQLLTELSAEEP